MNGTKATMLEMHARRNTHPFVRFDYRGHGESSGEFLDSTLGDWCAALELPRICPAKHAPLADVAC